MFGSSLMITQSYCLSMSLWLLTLRSSFQGLNHFSFSLKVAYASLCFGSFFLGPKDHFKYNYLLLLNYGRERQAVTFHLLVHIQNAHNSQSWYRPKPAWNSFWVFHLGGRLVICYLPGCTLAGSLKK